MAYNPHTRLLLNFEESGLVDSSSFGRTLVVSGDYPPAPVAGAGVFGTQAMGLGAPYPNVDALNGLIELADPSSLYTHAGSDTLSRTVDMWIYPHTPPTNLAQQNIFRTSDNEATFAIDLWYTDSASIDSPGTFTLQLAASNMISGDNAGVSATGSTAAFEGNWHHVRMRMSGSTVTLGLDGVDAGSGSFTLGDLAFPNVAPSTMTLQLGRPYSGGFQGLIDSFQILEGDDTWAGGAYSVPTNCPDPYYSGPTPNLYGTGSSTTAAITSFGTALGNAGIGGVGWNTLDDATCSAQCSVIVSGTSSVTNSDVVSSGIGMSVGWFGASSTTTDTVSTFCVGSAYWSGLSASTIEDTSTIYLGSAKDLVVTYWQNTVADFASIGTNYVPPELFGAGASSAVDATCSASAQVLTTGYCENTLVDTIGSGTCRAEFLGTWLSDASASSYGAGTVLVLGEGVSSTGVVSAGVCVIGPNGTGGNFVSTVTIGYGEVLCSGQGASVVGNVIGGEPAAVACCDSWFLLNSPQRMSLKTTTLSHRVRT